MNANTIIGYTEGTGRNQIPALAVPNATEIAALVNTDTGSTTAILAIPYGSGNIGASSSLDPNANGSITGSDFGRQYGRPNGVNAPYYSTMSFDGSPFKVTISGTATIPVTASQTFAVNLRLGTTIAGTLLAGPTAVSFATGGTFSFLLEAILIWDSTSHAVSGLFDSVVAGTGVGQATLTNNGSAVLTPAGLTFVATAKLGVAGTATVNFTEFSIAQV